MTTPKQQSLDFLLPDMNAPIKTTESHPSGNVANLPPNIPPPSNSVSNTAPPGEFLTLSDYAERAYLEYAISVVKGRALPEVSDGQKPVQRRLLYAMHAMGLSAPAKPVKSARVVGDVLGKYHPHGDQSAYDALVRLAQDFSLRYPLIDGQGNFGSRDGDGAAAMRYTEACLTPIAQLLLDEIDEGTVDFIPNYDGSMQEPKQLPARLPFVLLNGASGIAVGMATDMPSHNLREIAAAAVALLRDPALSTEALLELVPGPDFPGGGHLISSPEDIAAVYSTGRGNLKLRARWEIEPRARGQWQLVITELPHSTSGQKVLEEIEELTNPKIKLGKKTLSPEQLQTKQTMLALVDTVRDESGKEDAVRLVFEPKSSRIEPTEFAQTLLAHTSLELGVTINNVLIGLDGRPAQKPLKQILQEWLTCRMATLQRRTQFRFDKAQARIHILEGRMIVFLNIDEVIRIIRESDHPKVALIDTFSLSERQAEDILEIRLRQLARLESLQIEKELKELCNTRDQLSKLLESETARKRLLIKEIEADAHTYGDARRTLVQFEQRARVETRVVDEPLTVIISKKGWGRTHKGQDIDPTLCTFKTGDSLHQAFACRSTDTLLAFGNQGRVYSLPVTQLPGGRGDGVPLTSCIELETGTTLQHYCVGNSEQTILLTTQKGMGLLAKVSDMTSRLKGGKAFITIESSTVLLAPSLCENAAHQLACLSSEGRLLVFDLKEVKRLASGGRGVTLMGLQEGETLQQALAFSTTTGLVLTGEGRRGKQKEVKWVGNALLPHIAQRTRRGRVPDCGFKVTGLQHLI